MQAKPTPKATKAKAKTPNPIAAIVAAANAAPAIVVAAPATAGSVQLSGKRYRVGADHNSAWWAKMAPLLAAGPVAVAALVAAGVPTKFVNYTVRRGYLAKVN